MDKKHIVRQLAGIFILFAAIALPCGGSALAPDSRALVDVSLLADRDSLAPGEKFRLGLLFRISPGSHIYWINPGDAGLAPEIEWELPEGFRAGPVFWPAPQRMEEPGGLLVNVYTEEVLLFCWVLAPERIKDTSISLKARANWLVCRKFCTQESAGVSLELPVGSSSAESIPGRDIFSRYAARVPRPANEFPALRSDARWIGKLQQTPETRTGVIVLESLDENSLWLTGEGQFCWFGYPSEALGSGDIHYDSAQSSAGRLVLHLNVRKLEGVEPWPAQWGGVLTARLVKAGADTVSYLLSLSFTEQAQ